MRSDRPSSTAFVVAAGLARRAADSRTASLAPVECVEAARNALRSAGAVWRLLAVAAGRRDSGALLDGFERMLVPGISLHYCLRKRWIRDALRERGGDCHQALILGAGFDALGACLSQEGWRVLEVDHPATSGRKPAAPNCSMLRAIAADLGIESPTLTGLDQTKPVAVIAEGLLMYLELERVRALVEWVASTIAIGSPLLLTYMQPDLVGRHAFRGQSPGVTRWLRKRGEPFLWSLSPKHMDELLRAAGFEIAEHRTGPELLRRYAPGLTMRIAEGENVVLARRV